MESFSEFLEQLLVDFETIAIKIGDDEKTIMAMARYGSLNLDDEYIKIAFDDDSFMFVVPGEEEIYFTDEGVIGESEGIADEQIGRDEVIVYKGKKYKLENKDDYQYVVQRYLGGFEDIEGEVRFSDYVPEDEDEFLSLGWYVYDNKRGDVNPKLIDLEDIEIIEG